MSVSIDSAEHPDNSRLPSRLVWFYGLPGLITAVPMIPVFVLVPAFYTNEIGLGLVLTGMVLFFSRALDVITDPMTGWLADRGDVTRLPALVLWGALISGPALILLLSPPEGAGWLWLLCCSVFLYIGWTLVQIPYLTWGARLSSNYHQRTRVTASREGFVLIGIMLSGSLPALLGFYGLDEAARLSGLAWLTVLAGIPCFFLLLKYVHPPTVQKAARSDWSGLLENRLFLRLLSAWFINGLANAIPAVLFTFYCTYVLQVSDQTRNILLALYFICAVIGIPLWLKLSCVFSRHKTWSIAMLITCPAFALAAFLEPGQTELFALVCIITGLCLGADLILPPAIQADVADWDRLRFRRNRTAGLFSLWNMSAKLALAIAAGTTLPLLGILGLDDTQPSGISLTVLAVIYALVPCVLKTGAVAMVIRLPMTPARQRAIAVRLDRRDTVAQRI